MPDLWLIGSEILSQKTGGKKNSQMILSQVTCNRRNYSSSRNPRTTGSESPKVVNYQGIFSEGIENTIIEILIFISFFLQKYINFI